MLKHFLCLANIPYGLYQFTRFIAMIRFAYLGCPSNQHTNKNEIFIYIGLTLLFQPLVKIALGRTIWNIVDFIIGVGLLLSLALQNDTKAKQ
ncbi:DUF6804 family protein [Flavobacterium sp.]|uniref:DUF6804 family protein n=1 Tax=Flavobacterium sp. TaxID=239 RepID=UPI00261B765E|nr:DUF6804 family protein [Flavobacterium sp.]